MAVVKITTHPHGPTVALLLQAVIHTTRVLVEVPTVRTMVIHPIRAAVLAAPIAPLQPKVRDILRALAEEQLARMVKVAHIATSEAALTATITPPTVAVTQAAGTITATAVEEAVIAALATAVQVQAAAVQAQVAAVQAQVAAVRHADHAKWLE